MGERATPSSDVDRALELWQAVQVIERWAQRTAHRREIDDPALAKLSPNETHLLARLAGAPRQRLSELAQWQQVDRSTITLQITKLAGRDLVRRIPDPCDGRAQLVELTDHGRELLEEFLERSAGVLQTALAGWSEKDLDRFGADLQRFASDLDRALEER